MDRFAPKKLPWRICIASGLTLEAILRSPTRNPQMGMSVREDESPQATKAIKIGKEITRLIREAVTADRHSRASATGVRPSRWTDAARKRDDAFRYLREKMAEFAKEI
jgi:hypothetical protein